MPRIDVRPGPHDGGILGRDGKCNSLKRNGQERCELPAGSGTDHPGWGACRYHGGNSPALRKSAVRAQVRDMAQELDMDPHDALLFAVRLAAGTVNWIRSRILDLEESGSDGTSEELAAEAAMIESLHKVYGEERDRLAKAAKLAIDAGIDERRIQLEEDQGVLIAKAVTAILTDIGLTPEQKKNAPAIARKHLLALSAGD